jgi:hypothetical protein
MRGEVAPGADSLVPQRCGARFEAGKIPIQGVSPRKMTPHAPGAF